MIQNEEDESIMDNSIIQLDPLEVDDTKKNYNLSKELNEIEKNLDRSVEADSQTSNKNIVKSPIVLLSIILAFFFSFLIIYMMPKAFEEGQLKAQSYAYMNQAQQIQAAIVLASVDNVKINELEDLVGEYLIKIPKLNNKSWKISKDYMEGNIILSEGVSEDFCDSINLRAKEYKEDSMLGCAVETLVPYIKIK